MRTALRSLINYNNPGSLGSRLRRGRFAHIESLVSRVLDDKPTCEIIDIGGVARYWRLMDQSLLKSCRIKVVNIEEPWGMDPKTDQPNAGQFEFATGDGRSLNFEDGEFDIAHSNSVIEHVGSFADMQRFVRESARVARFSYIQTPYFWFPIEPHFGFPLIHWLPVPLRCKSLLDSSTLPVYVINKGVEVFVVLFNALHYGIAGFDWYKNE
ncbi:MAG: methyltransferase domain-containing protein, partial [Pseudomonadota bacterium]